MSRNRSYSIGTRAALAALSYGTCYWPGCTVPVVTLVNQKYRMNLQIAHIRPSEPNGPRGNESQSREGLNEFSNLVLLCKPHHEEVDEFPEYFTINVLTKWKESRERGQDVALSKMPELNSDEGLRQAISEAINERDRDLEKVLSRLEKNDAEAAVLLRDLQEQLTAARRSGAIIDPDSATMAHSAGRMLQHLPDSSEVAQSAAKALRLAVNHLAQLEGLPQRIESAAKHLEQNQQFM